MPSTVTALAQMADHAATQITASHESWTDFLKTAARLYKYPYHEQLMIFAQRPDATACAGYELWNEKMRRYIRRGRKGIALIDVSGDRPRIRYVFDLSDTGGRENSRRPFLWQYRPEHEDAVAAALEQEYAIPGEKGLVDQMEQIAGQLANEYWQEHQYDILHIVDGSFLEEYDEFNIGAQFRSAAAVSTTYAVLSRCGLEPDEYFEHEDFLSIFDFNTPDTVAALGTAVSEASEKVLRQIEVTVKNYEREHIAERSATHGEQSDLQPERGLSDSRPDNHGADGEHRQIREDAEELPEGTSSGAVQQPVVVGEAVPAPVGDRADGNGAAGVHDAGADEVGRRDGEPESVRPDALGGPHEQPESAGRGNNSDGAYLQLSFFPSEQEQIQRIDEAESEKPSAFSISSTQKPEKHGTAQADIDAALQEWNGDIESKHAVAEYMREHARDKDTAVFLRAEYGDDLPAFPVTMGRTSTDLPWPKVQRRIAQLIREERFYTQEEQPAPPDLSGQPITRSGDTIENGITFHNMVLTLSGEQRDDVQRAIPDSDAIPLPYKVGDTVYLDNKPFGITDIGTSDVQLRDPALAYPIFRAESRENFERLLRRDSRNGPITEFLAADLEHTDADLREALTSGLLEQRDKEHIAGYFHENEGNTRVAQRLSDTYVGTSDTMELTTGETADFFATTTGFEVDIHDKYNSKRSASWEEVAPILRALYQREQDGFSHEPVLREPANLDGKPSYEAGDHAVLDYGGQELSGTVGYVGEKDVRIDTGPYSWSHEVINRDSFENGIRQDERNAALFTPEQPAAENFRITDDHLGEGGAKTKYGYNIAAIHTLKTIEAEGRTATPEEQKTLSRYVGWGGIPQAFDPNNAAWSKEYAELVGALTAEEYEMARSSTLNAHYTSPTVIRAIYEAVGNMGFQTGNILEPACGVGNFFGLLPESMAASRPYGVELDSITGRIAKQLYPNANITVAGFETTNRRDFFDLAVGNVPFGSYKVSDRAYDKLGFPIHDYFFAKTLDQVRPGGVIAFVTSRYTMDKQSPEVRRYIAQRADLLGAIRLPSNAFKANAGTEVTTDILFLQKRDRPIVIEPDWVHLGQTEDGIPINSYFTDHPEMVLGTIQWDESMYGDKQETTCKPFPDADLSKQLHEAVSHLQGQIAETELPDLGENEKIDDSIPADPDVKNYSYTVVDGKVYYRENSRMVRPELSETAKARIMGMVELRDCVQKLISQQLDESASDVEIKNTQTELNQLYDAFSAKYGLINSRGNSLAFAEDSSYYLLCSLEVIDEDGKLERKADMFTKRTIRQRKIVTFVDTASEALALSIAEKARVDMDYMASLTGKTPEALADELRGVIFRDLGEQDPASVPKAFYKLDNIPFVAADEYLSGNVRRKLRLAKALAEMRPDLADKIAPNIEALEAAQPKDLDASEIEVRLGATWIDKEYIQQFMEELLNPPSGVRGGIRVNYSSFTAEWSVSNKSSVGYNNVAAYVTYGTDRANAYRILEDTLNLRDTRIYDTVTDPDGKERRVLNSKETTLAQQKQQAIKDAFRDWIWKDPERRQTLTKKYNELFNSSRPREYDGRHLVFPGMNPEIKLREHQLNAVAHQLYGGNTLLAHVVGAGKTYEMIAAAMEGKRLGLCQKSLFAVPNHLTEQWASEFLRLYPSANILVTTRKDFEKRNRKKFCARIATGDYDAIIMGHSQFEKIPVSLERQKRLIQEQIWEIENGLEELKDSGAEQFTIKQLERTKKGLEARLKRLNDNSRKDDVVTFEQLGVDRLFVDEAHNYKNLFLYTKMRNVAGLSTTDAQKSSDMFLKCRYLDEITHSRGVVFATGTPVSNSMTELYVRP
ncbi:DEAD/DEAH box helicase [Clostridium sp. W14A]|nr:DEAD/DEAH box helicase [Clostridium sp. W14A]